MYMQTALNTRVWKSYLQTAPARGTIHRQSTHSRFLLYRCISTLGDINLFGSTANTRTCDKASFKGNPNKFCSSKQG